MRGYAVEVEGREHREKRDYFEFRIANLVNRRLTQTNADKKQKLLKSLYF
jgi:hypothetical protein